MENVPHIWRSRNERLRMVARICEICDSAVFPDGPCRRCYDGRQIPLRLPQLSGELEIHLFPTLVLEVPDRV